MAASKTFATCPQCGGFPELDETGRPFTCYFCCDTGSVEQSVADAHHQAQQDRAEQFRPRLLGIYLRPMANEYDWGDEEFTAPPCHRLFTRLVRAERAERAAPALVACDMGDDIPF